MAARAEGCGHARLVTDDSVVVIGVHTITKESQEVIRSCNEVSACDEGVETLMVDADIPFSGQLNNTNSSLPDNPTYPGVPVK